jgi:hypothetical protein
LKSIPASNEFEVTFDPSTNAPRPAMNDDGFESGVSYPYGSLAVTCEPVFKTVIL